MTDNSQTPADETIENTQQALVANSDQDAAGFLQMTVAQLLEAPTLALKSEALLAMPASTRYRLLGEMPATMAAAIIESNPDTMAALIANLPAPKFAQIINLGTFDQGRSWLERVVESGSLAGAILPSLLTANDLANMLMTDREVRRALPKLLNYERAERWRQLLTTNEWHSSIDELLMSDAEQLLAKAPFKNKSIRAVLNSLLDFVPELYLETVNLALERSKRMEDAPDETDDLTSEPLSLPNIGAGTNVAGGEEGAGETSPLEELIPDGGDPVFALALTGLNSARKALLEEQLKNLLRQEIVATAAFAAADMTRAAGRVLFYLRAGLESFGPSIEDATRALETRHLNEISAIGAREAERYRQKSLGLSGLRDWLDSRQRQFLDAMKQPEAGINPDTREPVLYLAGKPKQPRAEWHPVALAEINQRLADIATWGSLARAAFGTSERTHAIFNTARTRTYDEALRRTVLALTLYRRWEPELIRPAEDYALFQRQFGRGKQNGIDAARQIVLDALDQTPVEVWKPSDARERAKTLLLQAVTEVENMPLPDPPIARQHRP